jgi:hypothetical protein
MAKMMAGITSTMGRKQNLDSTNSALKALDGLFELHSSLHSAPLPKLTFQNCYDTLRTHKMRRKYAFCHGRR